MAESAWAGDGEGAAGRVRDAARRMRRDRSQATKATRKRTAIIPIMSSMAEIKNSTGASPVA
jgi:hypothetical protein